MLCSFPRPPKGTRELLWSWEFNYDITIEHFNCTVQTVVITNVLMTGEYFSMCLMHFGDLLKALLKVIIRRREVL